MSVRSIRDVLLWLLVLSGIPAGALPSQYGVEMEYASEKEIQPRATEIRASEYQKILRTVKKAFGGKGSTIRMKPWEKYPEKGLQKAVYSDPMGREWQVVPESVNTTGFDGFEFVTPPLKTGDANEESRFAQILTEVADKKEFGKGVRSSSHLTFDATHLFQKNGDASKLLSTILYIESHWPDIYAAISPMRYGTIINRFAVPLSFDQPQLLEQLRQLSAKPKSQQTFAAVQAVFRQFESKELALKEGEANKAWKYRAAAYKKLFELGGESHVPVIEFRIPDFSTAQEAQRNLKLLDTMLEKAPSLQKAGTFKNPFEGVPQDVSLNDLGTHIYDTSKESFPRFLDELGMPHDKYAHFGRIRGPPTYALTDDAYRTVLGSVNLDAPIEHGGKKVSFGFEAEFKDGARAPSVVIGSGKNHAPDLEKFPYLSTDVGHEQTGNIEVRSVGGEWKFSEVERQMGEVSNALREDLRGFHLHMRVPSEAFEKIPEDELAGWFARVSDGLYGWRLENRRHFFALKTWSQVRLSPNHIDERGTIRVKQMDEIYDIEIRGAMGSREKVREFVNIILAGVKNPTLIRGFKKEQLQLRLSEDLTEAMQSFVSKYEHRVLSASETSALRYLDERATYKGQLPLMGFEKAPYLSPLEQQKVANANFNFLKRVRQVIANHESGKYGDSTELEKQYRYRIKQWAQEIGFEDLMKRSLFLDPEKASQIVSHRTGIDELIKKFQSKNGIIRGEAAMELVQRTELPANLEESVVREVMLNEAYDKSHRSGVAEQWGRRVENFDDQATQRLLQSLLDHNKKDPVLSHHGDGLLQEHLGQRLARVSDSTARNTLLRELSGVEDAKLRVIAWNGIKNLPKNQRQRLFKEAIDQIFVLKRGQNEWTVFASVSGLFKMLPAHEAELAMKLILARAPEKFRERAISAMFGSIEYGDEQAVVVKREALVKSALESGDSQVMKYIATSTVLLGGDDLIKAEHARFLAAGPEVAQAFLESLVYRDDAWLQPIILKGIGHADPSVQRAALDVAVTVPGFDKWNSDVAKAYKSGEPETRLAAAKVLARVNDSRAVALIPQKGLAAAQIDPEALLAMIRGRRDEKSKKILEAGLVNPDADIRNWSRAAMGDKADPWAADVWMKLWDGANWDFRAEMLRSYLPKEWEPTDPRILEQLQKILVATPRSSAGKLRAEAAAFLYHYQGANKTDALVAALTQATTANAILEQASYSHKGWEPLYGALAKLNDAQALKVMKLARSSYTVPNEQAEFLDLARHLTSQETRDQLVGAVREMHDDATADALARQISIPSRSRTGAAPQSALSALTDEARRAYMEEFGSCEPLFQRIRATARP